MANFAASICLILIAKAAENGGADAVSAINTVIGMSIDINTRKSKLFTNIGGLSGPAIKPIALANIHKLYSAINIPIIASGGITTIDDIKKISGYSNLGISGMIIGRALYENKINVTEAQKILNNIK